MSEQKNDWKDFFTDNKEIIDNILQTISQEEKKVTIYPDEKDIFKVFDLCPLNKIKVVILGQDPYHNGSANGIAFSIKEGNQINSSLGNLFNELKLCKYKSNSTGDLSPWVEKGVFLLNTALTVIEGTPESHLELWKKFTEKIINCLLNKCDNRIVWLLLGNKSYDYFTSIKGSDDTYYISYTHPSGLSYSKTGGKLPALKGSKCFTKINKILKKNGLGEIDWNLS